MLARHLRVGHAVQHGVIDERHELEVRAPLGVRRLAAEVARLRAQREEHGRGDLGVERDVTLAQVLEDDRRRRAAIGPNVAPGRARAARARRVVIDDDVDAVPGRQRVVARLGLAVDERDGVELVGLDALGGDERQLQRLDHGPILGASHDPAVGQRHARAKLVLEQPAEAHGRRERVGVRVVVRVDEDGLAAHERGEGAVEIEGRGLRRLVHGQKGAAQGAGLISRLSKLTSLSQSLTARYSCPLPARGSGSVHVRKGCPSIFQSIVPPLRVTVQ